MSIFHDKIRVEFADTDAAAVAHFSNYLRYMERVEHAFLRSLGVSVMTRIEAEHIGFPRVKVECEFFRPARFQDVLDAALTVERIGDKSVSYHVEFRLDGERVAAGRAVVACCRVTADGQFHGIEIPDFLRRPMQEFVEQAGRSS